MLVDGRRAVNPLNLSFAYVDNWSAMTTWGGASPPVEGDLVYIPKGQSILLDVSTPVLNTLIIEGTLRVKDTPLKL